MMLNSYPKSAAFAAVSGLVSAIPFWRSGPAIRRTVIVAPAVVAAAGGVIVARQPELVRAPHRQFSVPATAVIAAGAAVVTSGVMVGSLAFDGAIERSLVRRGVRRPRLVIAIGAGVLSFALDALERSAEVVLEHPVAVDE